MIKQTNKHRKKKIYVPIHNYYATQKNTKTTEQNLKILKAKAYIVRPAPKCTSGDAEYNWLHCILGAYDHRHAGGLAGSRVSIFY